MGQDVDSGLLFFIEVILGAATLLSCSEVISD